MPTIDNIQDGIRKIYNETEKLVPSSMITMFEIDVSDIAFDNSLQATTLQKVYRFHNSVKLVSSDIIWQGQKYIAAPINADGFEMNSKGTLPTPRMAMTVNEAGIDSLSEFKQQISLLGDLVGAKVTRIRTFAKFIDQENFFGQRPPAGFSPDPQAEFPRDVYFIERKSTESKTVLEFQLSSVLDVEGIKLPRRLVSADRCNFTYRGEGCLYEYDGPTAFTMRRNDTVHGTSSESVLPEAAPSVATVNDELIFGDIITDGTKLIDLGEYNLTKSYIKGSQVFIEKDGIKFYFVATGNVPAGAIPPNSAFWAADDCSRIIRGCRLRYGTIRQGFLPFGGFPATNKLGG